MGIGQAQHFQYALHTPILAPRSVQAIQHRVRFRIGQLRSEVTSGINFNNIIPGRARRTRHLLARGERHVPLGRPASIDHGNTFHEIFLQAGVLTIHRVCRVKAALAWQLQNLFSAG